jgi:hypothetical protein
MPTFFSINYRVSVLKLQIAPSNTFDMGMSFHSKSDRFKRRPEYNLNHLPITAM